MKSLVQTLSKFQGIMIILTSNLRYRCSMVKRNIYIVQLFIQVFSKQKFNFHLSAIDLHVSAIDCMLQFFKTLATDFQCNRFAWLCNRLHTQNIWKSGYWNPVQSICMKGAIDCLLYGFEKQLPYTCLFMILFHGKLLTQSWQLFMIFYQPFL